MSTNGSTPDPHAALLATFARHFGAGDHQRALRTYQAYVAAASGTAGFARIPTMEVFAALPPVPWLAEGLEWGPGRPSMVAGFGWSGKTLAVQAAALAVAAGRRVWGEFGARQARVLHIDYEQGRRATLRRYQRLARGMGLDPAELGGRLDVVALPPVYLSGGGARETYARECDGVGLCVLDSFRAATPGVEENSSEARAPLDDLTWVAERTGTTFVVVHHSGKPSDAHNDARAIPRGSSGIFDACGAVHVLSAPDKAKPTLVRQVKGSADGCGLRAEDFYLRAEDVAGDGDPHAGLRVVYQTREEVVPPNAPTAGYDARRQRVLECVRANPGARGKEWLAEQLEMRATSVRVIVDQLLDDGAIVDRGEPKRPRYYARGGGHADR